MKYGICKECFEDVPLTSENDVDKEHPGNVYECPKCGYPNGISCGDFWEIYEK